MDRSVAYQNKDITSKLFADCFKGKSLNVYGIDDYDNSYGYSVKWKSSDKRIAYFDGNELFAKKAGEVTITAEISNSLIGTSFQKSVVVNITEPVYKEGEAEWDNDYYAMYGECYKKLFKEYAYFIVADEIEKDMTDNAVKIFNDK